MALKAELEGWTYDVFSTSWSKRDGVKVPDDDSRLSLKNEAIEVDGTVLYADIADSTIMVDSKIKEFSAEIYKTFLYCAAKLVREQGGTITAYDGDRIMAVYMGDSKESRAAITALKIKWAVEKIIHPQMKRVYSGDFTLNHVTGIDTSKLLVAKTGVRGANDLVWVGRAANYAAKLAALPATATYITRDVYMALSSQTTYKHGTSTNMWEKYPSTIGNIEIYRSGWSWVVS